MRRKLHGIQPEIITFETTQPYPCCHKFLSKLRYCIASLMWSGRIAADPARSAIDHEEDMKPTGGNGALPTKTIRILMQGIEEAFAYEVEATEQARIERYFRELASGGRVKDFIIFETSDHTITVIVRRREVKSLEYRERFVTSCD